MSFCEWMQAALYDEDDGYYCRADRIPQGRAGDYRTAPETSPLFAATFARYISKLFTDLKWPTTFTIFEAGAGSGEFAQGVLNSLKADAPEVFEATNYVIDEVSPAAGQLAAERLSEFAGRVTFQHLADINQPVTAGIVFSNELIDAFPVHRVIRRDGELRELNVGLNADDFVWITGELNERVEEYCQRVELQLSEGQIAEVNLGADEFISRAASVIEHGFVITVDYGVERNELLSWPDRPEGTLRAFHHHQLVSDVLARPGQQDLTTTIDWTQIKEAGHRAGLRTVRFERLDRFLIDEGLLDEMVKIMRYTSVQSEALRLSTSAREMVLPYGLAAYFQVLVQEKSV